MVYILQCDSHQCLLWAVVNNVCVCVSTGTLDRLNPRGLEQLYAGELSLNVATLSERSVVRGRLAPRPMTDARDSHSPVLLKRPSETAPVTLVGMAWLAIDSDCTLHFEVRIYYCTWMCVIFNARSSFFLLWLCSPVQAMASLFTRFRDHTRWHTTVGRTPLDEWSACRRDLYLTTHNRKISMPPVVFEPMIAAGEQL
jgi:hypothetical protein